MVVFETKRLVVRTATVADVDVFYDLWTNPQVMAYVGFPQGLRTTRGEIEERIRKQDRSEFEALLVVEQKTAGQAIGECHLHRPNTEGIAVLDVKLLPAFWGNKFGVEVQRGLLAFLFTHIDCAAVQGTPNRANIASIKMHEAVGAVRTGEGVYEFPESMQAFTLPVRHHIYRVYREDWQQEESTSSAGDLLQRESAG
jgi:RimJ/RimL family protein N-acetyltransferase